MQRRGAEMGQSERMSPVDTTWLRMDRSVNRMVIVGVMKLRGRRRHRAAGAHPVGAPARLSAISSARRDRADRIVVGRRCRISTSRAISSGCGFPARAAKSSSKLSSPNSVRSRSIRRIRSGNSTSSRITRAASRSCAQFHHAIADGMALVAVLLSMTDETPDAPLHGVDADFRAGPGRAWPWPVRADGESRSISGVQASGELWRLALKLLARPSAGRQACCSGGVGVASELAYLLLMPRDSPTRFKGAPCGSKRVAWSVPLALPEVKAISRALDCSVNDMLLASVAGALRRLSRRQGRPDGGG